MKFPLLELLPDAERPAILSRLKMERFGKGQVVYERGGDCTDVFFIFEGMIRVGEGAFFHTRGPGEMIGWESAVTEQSQPFMSTAIENSLLGRMRGPEFVGLVLGSPDLSKYMLRLSGKRLVEETDGRLII